MKILNSYSPSVRQAAPKSGPSLTEQHHKKACDINNIVAKYQKTGLVEHVNKHQGTYGDVSGADFKAALDLVAEQKSIFYELPSSVREQFDNDPSNYLDLMQTDEGVEELQGILNPQGLVVEETPSEDVSEAPTKPTATEETVAETS